MNFEKWPPSGLEKWTPEKLTAEILAALESGQGVTAEYHDRHVRPGASARARLLKKPDIIGQINGEYIVAYSFNNEVVFRAITIGGSDATRIIEGLLKIAKIE